MAQTTQKKDDSRPAAAAPSQHDNEVTSHSGSFFFFTAMPSWLTSTIVHVIVLLALALVTMPAIRGPQLENELVLGDNNDTLETFEEFQDQQIDSIDVDIDVTSMMVEPDTDLVAEEPLITEAADLTATAVKVELSELGLTSMPTNDLVQPVGALSGDALAGRGAAAKARLLREGGGTPGSEAAVAAALKWLAAHQLQDGGWSLDHRVGECRGQCGDPGKRTPARNGATALALLPFLGAGNTHEEGEYKTQVAAGIQFLLRSMKVVGPRGSLVDRGGNYYSHGLCAIALCEAYAMTKDKTLMEPAQLLINETVFAQDPIGGGWRYEPQMPGDTSAVGWQLMALKSAHMGYLQVPGSTIQKAKKFLDSVQSDYGARYGYTAPGNRKGTTSVGLLCRMYLGWDRDDPNLQRGVAYISEKGPSDHDMYYNYYATQVLRHYAGEEWKKWNQAMRDFLINEQETRGHAAGSWMFRSGHSNESGGRLYCTSMCTMILEVYYRHLPLYREEASEDDFPL